MISECVTPGVVAVHQWLCTQTKTFFADGIKTLVRHSGNCIAKEGYYEENVMSFVSK